MVPVPVIDLHKKEQSYTHLHVTKPYITLNSETYISLINWELRTCQTLVMNFIEMNFCSKTQV